MSSSLKKKSHGSSDLDDKELKYLIRSFFNKIDSFYEKTNIILLYGKQFVPNFNTCARFLDSSGNENFNARVLKSCIKDYLKNVDKEIKRLETHKKDIEKINGVLDER